MQIIFRSPFRYQHVIIILDVNALTFRFSHDPWGPRRVVSAAKSRSRSRNFLIHVTTAPISDTVHIIPFYFPFLIVIIIVMRFGEK